jgi:hypothetical protein
MNILDLIYPKEEIYINEYKFNEERLSIIVTFLVPNNSYTKKQVRYVTAENYVRCFSQASYLLAHHAIKERLIITSITEEMLLEAMEDYALYYRNLSMTFHKRSLRGEKFEMELLFTNFREIKSLKDYILFSFTSKRAVISGEMSFVFLK